MQVLRWSTSAAWLCVQLKQACSSGVEPDCMHTHHRYGIGRFSLNGDRILCCTLMVSRGCMMQSPSTRLAVFAVFVHVLKGRYVFNTCVQQPLECFKSLLRHKAMTQSVTRLGNVMMGTALGNKRDFGIAM
jgi:hypothetical protein